MKMLKGSILFLVFILFLSACSSAGKSDEKSAADSTTSKSSVSQDLANSSEKPKSEEDVALNENELIQKQTDNNGENSQNRMVIYEANIHIRVKNFTQTQQSLEEKTKKFGGYVVQSVVYREEENLSGTMTIRIPEMHFQEFLRDAEGEAVEVIQRDVSGKDVTEEFVDLESRLKSKRAVEERLLEFMKGAAKTEDLLKISSDLANVQEEIEQIVGKMNFIRNQTSYSTITIALFENQVVVPSFEKQEINTWERTKKQFMTSLNWLLSFTSGLIVFVIGNLPVLVIMAIVVCVIYLFFIKRKKKENIKPDDSNKSA
jgi:hypothetical protein